MSLKVIGVGLHRTGTLSTKVALERLGFGPAYHGFEWVGRLDHVRHWRTAVDRDGDVDWHLIFGDYRAALDWPMVYFWDKVIAAHPSAKVLLTERDPESWFDSHLWMLQAIEQARQTHTMPAPEVERLTFELLASKFSDRLLDKDHCIEVYQRHYQQVRETVPPQRLLGYRVADGWGPLCRFLNVDPPAEPFPRVNTRRTFLDNGELAITRDRQKTEGMQWL
jgi:hypothetical protein